MQARVFPSTSHEHTQALLTQTPRWSGPVWRVEEEQLNCCPWGQLWAGLGMAESRMPKALPRSPFYPDSDSWAPGGAALPWVPNWPVGHMLPPSPRRSRKKGTRVPTRRSGRAFVSQSARCKRSG